MEVLLVLVLIFWLLPVVLVYFIADSRGRSAHYVWWPIVLGWLGAVIAACVILVQAERPSAHGVQDALRNDRAGHQRRTANKSAAAVAAARRSHDRGLHQTRPDEICPLCASAEAATPVHLAANQPIESEAERRLRQIGHLHETGLITDDEYVTRRERILDEAFGPQPETDLRGQESPGPRPAPIRSQMPPERKPTKSEIRRQEMKNERG